MKTTTLISSLALLLATASPLRAGDTIAIPWSSFTGGGGIGQCGAIAIGGAIGPIAPALAPATGGDYTLSGGFWPALSSQPQPASPVLKIKSLGSGKALISWPVAVTGFTLEFTTHLGSGVWHPETGTVVDTETEHTVTVSTHPDFRCFRLRSL